MGREHIFYSSPFCSAFKSDRYGASNKLLYEWQLKGKKSRTRQNIEMRFGFEWVKLSWRVRAKWEKNNRLAWCAADPEQMGKVNGVSLTHGSNQNYILIFEMPK